MICLCLFFSFNSELRVGSVETRNFESNPIIALKHTNDLKIKFLKSLTCCYRRKQSNCFCLNVFEYFELI